jgi:hypothetical protein
VPQTTRQADLLRVRAWFAPAFAPDEVLVAAVATTPFRLTMLNSLVATGKALVGHNQARILLLTDRSIHVVARTFWRRRLRGVVASYPLGTVRVTLEREGHHASALGLDSGAVLCVGDQRFHLNVAGFQLGGEVGTGADVELFLGSSRA